MSNRTSCIEHPAKQALVIIREDYLAICNGDDCAAALLNYFEQWTNSKLDAHEQWQRQCEIAEKTGEPAPAMPDVWIYASQEQIQSDLLFTYGERKIGAALDWLVDVGFLIARHNPKHGWDRTKQYLFEVEFVQLAIRKIASSNSAEMRNGSVQNRVIDSGKNAEAIPKNTTKKSSKNTKRVSQPIVRDGVYDAILEGWGLGDDGLVPRIRTALFEVWEFTDYDWVNRFVKWYKHKNNGLSLPIDATKLKNWYGKFHKDPLAVQLTTPQSNGLTQLQKAMSDD